MGSETQPGAIMNPVVAEAAAAAMKAAAAYMDASGGEIVAVNQNPGSVLPSKGTVSFVIPKNKFGIHKAGQSAGSLVPMSSSAGSSGTAQGVNKEEDYLVVKPRKTLWGPDPLQDPAVQRGRVLALQTRAEQIASQLESGFLDLDMNEATRSPSPPPIYGDSGQRVNTREARKREQLDLERREAIGECVQLCPTFKPPAGYKPVLKEAKLFLPVKSHPGYNFIGLILGPRGNTQKRMEQETGAKIVIRGKGAVKDGKSYQGAGRRDGKFTEGANEDLHVYICGDTIEKVDAAVALIEPLLTPVDETRNNHKRKQLQELAKMNGTIRDIFCRTCGEPGHCDWQCPTLKIQTFQAKVTCGYCGDGGHPSSDCPLKSSGANQGKLDTEYAKLLEELGGKPPADESQPSVAPLPSSIPPPPLPSTSRPPLHSNPYLSPQNAPNFPPNPPRSEGPRWPSSFPGSEAPPSFQNETTVPQNWPQNPPPSGNFRNFPNQPPPGNFRPSFHSNAPPPQQQFSHQSQRPMPPSQPLIGRHPMTQNPPMSRAANPYGPPPPNQPSQPAPPPPWHSPPANPRPPPSFQGNPPPPRPSANQYGQSGAPVPPFVRFRGPPPPLPSQRTNFHHQQPANQNLPWHMSSGEFQGGGLRAPAQTYASFQQGVEGGQGSQAFSTSRQGSMGIRGETSSFGHPPSHPYSQPQLSQRQSWPQPQYPPPPPPPPPQDSNDADYEKLMESVGVL